MHCVPSRLQILFCSGVDTKFHALLSGCVFLLCRAGRSCQVLLCYCYVKHKYKQPNATSSMANFMQLYDTLCSRLEMEYVSGLEKLAFQLEEEADIIRGFLVKNYGHFDSRWGCWHWWMVVVALGTELHMVKFADGFIGSVAVRQPNQWNHQHQQQHMEGNGD